ncbi:MAG: alcohol dehydrogenase catalytic domain-containing protein [Chloroflexi bacterium]|jgi:2-desacetyl-2-hydroxyethyl bacteriochlorophyllide A dehydrogenase|nr:alcohol dehydrogenase catalytic domain-containing protein [Chloroflexota bacterium]
MKAAVVEGPNQLVVRDVPMPTMGPYDALVRIEACSICNATDRKIVERQFVTSIPVPLVLGHESVGTIIQVGERVRRYKPGQRVLRPGVTYDYDKVGIASAWGGFAQYGLVTDMAALLDDQPDHPVNGMWPKQQIIPEYLDPVEATAIITLKETLFAIRAADVNRTTRTAIVGTGPVARSFIFWAHWIGVPYLAVLGRSQRWCEECIDLGADSYMVIEDRTEEETSAKSPWGSFDRVIDAVGSNEALESALALVSPTGLVGNYGVPEEDDAEGIMVRAARESGRIIRLPVREEDVHDEVLSLIENGTVVLRDWISHRLPLEQINEGFAMLARREAFKVVIEL